MNELWKLFYDCEGPLGIPMKDAQALAIEAILKEQPKDELFAPGKVSLEKATTDILSGERADVSWITTEDRDRISDVVLAKGMDDSHFKLNPVVTLQHAYGMCPAGRSVWRKRVHEGTVKGVKAKTLYPTRPDSLPEGARWLPDEVYPLVQAQLLNGKSIGFIPRKAHWVTDEERNNNPALAGVKRVVEEWILLEYALCYFPCNPMTMVEAVGKGLVIPPDIQKALDIDLGALQKAVPERKPLVGPILPIVPTLPTSGGTTIPLPGGVTPPPDAEPPLIILPPPDRDFPAGTVRFTRLEDVEKRVLAHLAGHNLDEIARKAWQEGYAKACGRV